MIKYSTVLMLLSFSFCKATNPPDPKDPPKVQCLYHGFERWFVQGHSYITFKKGYGLGMVHDPDCECLEKNE